MPASGAAAPPAIPAQPQPAAAGAALSYADRQLFRHGTGHRIIAGALHYFRIHPDQWQDRIERLVALGVNTLDSYVAWNFHQPSAHAAPDFSGWKDLARFITMAGEAGLDVIVRPGPYICAEWDNGGFPAWATSTPNVVLRSSDPLFTSMVANWFDALMPVLAPLQACHGGPIVAVQVENEYGSYGDDQNYLHWNRQALRDRGISEMLFTADGGTDYFLDGGALPDTWAAATLGSRGAEANSVWERRRPGEPFFTVEFWNGWFDHWGEDHHTRGAADAAAEVRQILDVGGSICLYMAHGGTNFGLASGANHDGGIQATVTSYDSDAPIAEDGRLTPKFHALRQEFFAASGREPVPVPDHLVRPAPVLPAADFELKPGTPLLDFARAAAAVPSIKPLSFEQLGLDRGLVHYSARAVLPRGRSVLKIRGLHDRAYIWIDGAFAGILSDADGAQGLPLNGAGGLSSLEILVENQGRINYGPHFGEGKGILDGVLINQRYVFHWEQRAIDLELPLEQLLELGSPGAGVSREQAAGWYHGVVDVAAAADSHLALPGFGKGMVWLNGFLLGRFWEIGPQTTLYMPKPLFKTGLNHLTVLELVRGGCHGELREAANLGQAKVTYVEDLG
ncbi:beta-galactosidase family protein [Specibacter sp. NPDC057265]|uniref:glycoside hydrolase family 35 protein n=1 Tax=Specibacter sp. NPDC057265 TaxID=3346075 RepID=UPI0036338D39